MGWNVIEAWYQPARGTVQIWAVQNWGSWIQYGTDIPVTFQAGDQFGARAKADGTVEIYKNGTLVGSAQVGSDWTAQTSGGTVGVWLIGSGSTTLDDFGGGTHP